MRSPKPRADDSRMQQPSSPADKHYVHNSPLAMENSWSCTSPAEAGPGHEPGTRGARALARGFSLQLAGTGAPHRRNLCPWGHRLVRVSSQNSWGLHRASEPHALVPGMRNMGHTRVIPLQLLRSTATFKHRALPGAAVIPTGE